MSKLAYTISTAINFGGNYTLSGAGFNNLQQKVDNNFYEPQGGTTLPEVQITYSNGKFSEPSYDIHAYVQGKLDGITFDKGGLINDKNDFYNFMRGQAISNPVEVAAFGLKDGNYFVQPWKYNTINKSENDFDLFKELTGVSSSQIIRQYHSHPRSGPPSKADAVFSISRNLPVTIFRKDNSMWEVYSIFSDWDPRMSYQVGSGPYGWKIH
ncbi:MAG: hypothetical protein JSU07_09790 [Bacteroidetes bacterium]|nr:hypothetical protein [Bacteroidota bacterium]